MKTMYVTLCGIVMMMSAACSDDNGKIVPAYTEEEKIWIEENRAYFEERKAETEDDGSYLYRRLVVEDDTLLYRILSTSGIDSLPSITSNVKVSISGTLPVSKTVIVGGSDGTPVNETLDLDSQSLIKGLSALLLEIRKGERVETIIPYQLGYGDRNYYNPYIPLCSTLRFTFTVNSFE